MEERESREVDVVVDGGERDNREVDVVVDGGGERVGWWML